MGKHDRIIGSGNAEQVIGLHGEEQMQLLASLSWPSVISMMVV